jgi:acyl-CoA synthetase (AMP-forming)/AMP-acid ligase II
MHLSTLLEMIESGFDERVLLGSASSRPITGAELGRLARVGASLIRGQHESVVYVGENHALLPVALLSAAWAGVPFVPVNYRLEDKHLNALVDRQPHPLVLTDEATSSHIAGHTPIVFESWLASLPDDAPAIDPADDDDQVAIVLYTSGTTSEPKSALLRHRHLMAYLLGSVEFGGAGEDEAVLVSVPPYHIAGMANMLSNLFAGRRIVYLPHFDPRTWLSLVQTERVSHAMVVPTMLARIVDAVDELHPDVSTLRSLSYGGSKVSERVLRRALHAFPHTGFVNAYGLTETASTIAVLGPEDHRAAIDSDDPAAQRRLSSAGRILPSIEIELRGDDDRPVAAGLPGIIYLRGEQVSGEYATGSTLDSHGWFCTRDRGWLDAEGYLFIEGRADDTIIHGGENIAPAEIEEVLLAHPEIVEACVVGVPDDEWGQRIVAVVVVRPGSLVTGEDLRDSVRSQLRSSRTPEVVVFRDSLPHTDTGKLLRRIVLKELADQPASS